MKVRLVSFTPKPLEAIATAAAITRGTTYDEFRMAHGDGSWKTQSEYRRYLEQYVKGLYEAGHWSVFEFADFDFEVEGVSRVFETQAVRSRIGSYEWESGRVASCAYKASDMAHELGIVQAIEEGIADYEINVSCGSFAEDARYMLPQGVARKGRIKKNFRAWMETSHQRLCSRTQAEYREFMQEVKGQITGMDELLGSLLIPKCEWLGYCTERNGCGHMPSKTEVLAGYLDLLATTKVELKENAGEDS